MSTTTIKNEKSLLIQASSEEQIRKLDKEQKTILRISLIVAAPFAFIGTYLCATDPSFLCLPVMVIAISIMACGDCYRRNHIAKISNLEKQRLPV